MRVARSVIVVSLAFSTLGMGGQLLGQGRPNVLLITADDLGIQLSCYGDTVARTPHIDRLAGESVLFRTAYISQASCSPSRSTMFTGLYPHGNGHYGLANANVGFQLDPELYDDLLPNVLKEAGYRTGIIGKLHVNPENRFDFDQRYREGFGSRDVRQQVTFAREFIGNAGEAPWFLMFSVFDPHVARDRQADGSRGPQYLPDRVRGLPETILDAEDVPPWPWQGIDHPDQRTKIAGYYNCVGRVDAAIGLLMAALRDLGQFEDTVILFLGDHGPPFARGKTSCYEAGLRVPLIVRWPGVSRPHVTTRLAGSVDLYPTILDAASIELPRPIHGRSLRPVLQPEGGGRWRETLVAEFHYHGANSYFPRRAITDGRYKLIYNLRAGEVSAPFGIDGDRAFEYSRALPEGHPARLAMDRLADPPTWELYDLAVDPVEFYNRAGDSAMGAVERRLKDALAAWGERTGDPFRDPEFRQEIEARYRERAAGRR